MSMNICVSDLVCVIREVDFVEDLGCFMLDGLHFHQMRGILPGSITVIRKTTRLVLLMISLTVSAAVFYSVSSRFAPGYWSKLKYCKHIIHEYLSVSSNTFSSPRFRSMSQLAWRNHELNSKNPARFYRRALCSLCMQSPERGWCFLDWRKRWMCGISTLLGGNRPVHNHSSSQPFSSLYLQQHKAHVKSWYWKTFILGFRFFFRECIYLELCCCDFKSWLWWCHQFTHLTWLSVSCLMIWQ